MGTGFTVECSKCNYSHDYSVGVGFLFAQEYESLLSHFLKGEERERVRSAVGDHTVVECAFENAIFRCPSCHTIEGLLDYRVAWRGGEVIAERKCSKCDRLMKRVEIEPLSRNWLEDLGCICPRCAAPLRSGHGLFLWD
jgi:hypothetical protein